MIRKLIAIVALLLAGSSLYACPSVACVRTAVVRRVQQVVATQAVVTVAAPVLVPTYTAGYQPDSTAAILAELQKLRAEIVALRAPPAAAAPAKEDGKLVMSSTCAKCHTDGNADASGGGFVLIEKDGKQTPLSLAEKRRIGDLVTQGKMPPKNPLQDAQKTALFDFLNGK